VHRGKPFLVGALTFVALHVGLVVTWSRWVEGGDRVAPWFMNSTKTVAATLTAFGVATLVLSAARSATERDAGVASAAWIASGGAVPMVAVLFAMRGGPGTLWPIAIFLGWWILFAGAALGSVAAWLIQRVGRRRGG